MIAGTIWLSQAEKKPKCIMNFNDANFSFKKLPLKILHMEYV